MGWSFSITEEMRAMGLSGNELIVFALINSCTMRGNGCYYGGISFLCEVCGISRRTAFNILESLITKEFITKTETSHNGVKYSVYTTSAKSAWVVQNLHSGSAKSAPNNISNNINDNRDIKGFVPPTIEEVRAFCSARGNTIDAEEFVAHYTSNGWMVGKARMKDWKSAVITWEKSRKREQSSRPAPQRKKSVLENNIEVFDALFGTNEHARIFGQREDYDEQ